MGEHLKKEHEECEKRRAKMAKEERREREQRKKLEVKSFRQLARDAQPLEGSQVLREYINQKEREALAENNMTDEMVAWLEWARKK